MHLYKQYKQAKDQIKIKMTSLFKIGYTDFTMYICWSDFCYIADFNFKFSNQEFLKLKA